MPRWAHRMFAVLTGYDWYVCPCGREFGGHEASGITVAHPRGYGRMPICPACTTRHLGRDKAERLEW